MGRVEEAITENKRAVELDPLSLTNNERLGIAFFVARQYDKAIEQEQKTLELDPNRMVALGVLGTSYVQKTMYKEGIAEFEKMLAISPNDAEARSLLGDAYAVAGRTAEAQKAIDKLNEISKQKYVPAGFRARIYAGLRDKKQALEWLEKGCEERSMGPPAGVGIKVDPAFDPLRSDPQFTDLLRCMNLTP